MTRRLIALGRKYPEYGTQMWTYVTDDPAWSPQPDPQIDEDEPDYDYYRKRDIEDALARGDDL